MDYNGTGNTRRTTVIFSTKNVSSISRERWVYRETTCGIRQRFSKRTIMRNAAMKEYDNGNQITAMRKYRYNKGNKVALLDISQTKRQRETNVL